jgi:hypothetical protein
MQRIVLAVMPALFATAFVAPPLHAETAAETQAAIQAEVQAYHPPPEGYPPAMGGAVLTEGADTFYFTTFDYSIGAFDASAFFLGMESGAPTFTLTAWPNGDEDAKSGLLRVEGTFSGVIGPGSTDAAAVVAISIKETFRGRRWTSEGGEGVLVIDSFVPQTPGSSSGYGHATGHFTARICSADGDPAVVAKNARCRAVTGSFETDVQYEP